MTKYTDYPFITNGVKFVSRVYSDSPFLSTIKRLPEGAFVSLNIQAITELIGDASLLTRNELEKELEKINAGGTHAFLMLGDN